MKPYIPFIEASVVSCISTFPIVMYIYLSIEMVKSEDIQYKLEEINNFLGKKYAMEHPVKDMGW